MNIKNKMQNKLATKEHIYDFIYMKCPKQANL